MVLTSFRSFLHAPDFIRSNLTNSKNLNFISNAFSFFSKEKKIPLTLLWCWYDDWLFFFRNRKSLPFSLSKSTLLLKHTSETSFIPLQINILLLLSGGTSYLHGENKNKWRWYCWDDKIGEALEVLVWLQPPASLTWRKSWYIDVVMKLHV